MERPYAIAMEPRSFLWKLLYIPGYIYNLKFSFKQICMQKIFTRYDFIVNLYKKIKLHKITWSSTCLMLKIYKNPHRQTAVLTRVGWLRRRTDHVMAITISLRGDSKVVNVFSGTDWRRHSSAACYSDYRGN